MEPIKKLAVSIYSIFSSVKDFGLKDQIQRASVSVMSNIAEGHERQSNKEFIKFLYYAKGSSGEVRSLLILANELNFIDNDISVKFINKYARLSSSIYKLIDHLRNNS